MIQAIVTKIHNRLITWIIGKKPVMMNMELQLAQPMHVDKPCVICNNRFY